MDNRQQGGTWAILRPFGGVKKAPGEYSLAAKAGPEVQWMMPACTCNWMAEDARVEP